MGCPELPIEYFSGPSGKRKSLVVAFADGSKKVTEWSYDKFGRLEKIKDNGKEVVYTYDFKSRLAEKSLPGGLFESYDYDSQNRLVRKALQGRAGLAETAENKNPKPIAELKYFYSNDGMIAAREVNGKLQNYEYDFKGQLTCVKDKDGKYVEQYVYDPTGNILEKTVGGKKTSFTYDTANQLATAILPDGSKQTFEYDGAGRLAKEGNKSYAYGWTDKVLRVVDNGNISNFEYFADGQIFEVSRAFQPDNSLQTENFVWDGLALIKRDKTDYTIEPAVTGGNAILAGNKVLFNDMLGNSLGSFFDSKFSEITRNSFGENASPVSDDFFTGKPMIPELGYNFLFRNYKPETGKWMSADPLGYIDGWNNTAYVKNRVTSYFDFMGAWGVEIHQTLTAVWAEAMGFTPEQAARIANADNGVDASWGFTGPTPWGNLSRHFDTDGITGTDSRQTNADNEMALAVQEWQNGNQNAGLDAFGRALHSLQDIDAHENWDPWTQGIHPDWYDDPGDDSRTQSFINTFDRTVITVQDFRGRVGLSE